MAELIDEFLNESGSSLKKIVGGNGKTPGTFCVAKGQKSVGLAIFLQKKDKSGAKVKGASKVFKSEKANKFAIGTVNVEEGKLVFRVMHGTLSAGAAQKTLRKDFASAPSPLPALLRKSMSSKGVAPVSEEDKVIDGVEVEHLDISQYQEESRQEIEKDVSLSPEEKTQRLSDLSELWSTQESTVEMEVTLSSIYDELIADESDFDDQEIDDLSQLEGSIPIDPAVLEPEVGSDMGVISSTCKLMAKLEKNRTQLKEQRDQYNPILAVTLRDFGSKYTEQVAIFQDYLKSKDDTNYHKIAVHVQNILLTPHVTAINTAAGNIADYSAVASIKVLDTKISEFIDFLSQNYKIKTIDQCISGSDLGDGLVIKLQDIQEHINTYPYLA
jgi:hypothetical protein